VRVTPSQSPHPKLRPPSETRRPYSWTICHPRNNVLVRKAPVASPLPSPPPHSSENLSFSHLWGCVRIKGVRGAAQFPSAGHFDEFAVDLLPTRKCDRISPSPPPRPSFSSQLRSCRELWQVRGPERGKIKIDAARINFNAIGFNERQDEGRGAGGSGRGRGRSCVSAALRLSINR